MPLSIPQIQTRALEVIDRIQRGSQDEVTLDEVKLELPEPTKAARQLAGQANAARGEDVLWLVGVGDDGAICGAAGAELSTWWATLQKQFDGAPPSMREAVLTVDDKDVICLLFETLAPPYVIVRRDRSENSHITHEVPWREGTGTRTANRNELLRILTAPATSVPQVELLSGGVELKSSRNLNVPFQASQPCTLTFKLELYVTPASESRVVIPLHRVDACISGSMVNVEGFKIKAHAPTKTRRTLNANGTTNIERMPDSLTITATGSEMIFLGPGKVTVGGTLELERIERRIAHSELAFELKMLAVNSEFPALLRAPLTQTSGEEVHALYWDLGPIN